MRFAWLIAILGLCFGQVRDSNPMRQIWLDVKQELLKPDGDKYFDTSVKGTEFPRMRGTVTSSAYTKTEGTLMIRIDGQTDPEVKLILTTPVKTFFREGDIVQFEGVPKSFTQTPYVITFYGAIISVPAPK